MKKEITGNLRWAGKMQIACAQLLRSHPEGLAIGEIIDALNDFDSIVRQAANGLIKRKLAFRVRDTRVSGYRFVYKLTPTGKTVIDARSS
jgi:predicted transcriptional regulator